MKPVAKIVGVDEYGPITEWSTHWAELNGVELCVATPDAAILQAATRDTAAIPTGCVVIEEADMVPHVHPQYGSGLFVTEDCVNKMSSTRKVVPKLRRTIDTWRKCEPTVMAHMSEAAIAYAFDDLIHDVLALAASSPKGDGND